MTNTPREPKVLYSLLTTKLHEALNSTGKTIFSVMNPSVVKMCLTNRIEWISKQLYGAYRMFNPINNIAEIQ